MNLMEKEKIPLRTRIAKSKAFKATLPAILVLVLLCAGLSVYASRRLANSGLLPVSAAEREMAVSAWKHAAPQESTQARGLHEWKWPEEIDGLKESGSELAGRLYAASAILLDAETGAVLLEKKADSIIPPASMTKLVAMYAAFRAVEAGEAAFDDVVDLPPESWAVNIPPGSSLMFLGEGQIVTVRELLLGMAVASGNDAAIAVAFHIAGSVEAFVGRMNAEMERIGLSHTNFTEPSGLSEFNATTAREFAAFSREYIARYPQALKAFNSQTRIEYPMPWNLPEGRRESPVIQSSTNKLLGTLKGCDGLKTGYIHESGYNLALTAERDGSRFISITMGGPGNGSFEGNILRNSDGASLMEWAFANFATIRSSPPENQAVTVWAGKQPAVYAVPVLPASFTAPRAAADGKEPVSRIILPKAVRSPVRAGDVLGSLEYLIDGETCYAVPLVADRNSDRAGIARRAIDRLAELISGLF